VYPDGRREPCKINHDTALEFATSAAEAFGVGESRMVPFEKERANRDVKADDSGKSKSTRGTK
jgi:CRISPR-associated protein Csb1